MPTRTSYAQGTPNWVDLQTSDQAGMAPFDVTDTTPVGRIAVLGDPQGAVFSVIKSA